MCTHKKKEIKELRWWHYWFAFTLDYLFKDTGYTVESNVKVGSLPLELDVLIIENKKVKGKPAHDDLIEKLGILFNELNKYTIIEFKSSADQLDPEDYDKLRAYALLYKLKGGLKLDSEVTIMTVSSVLSDKYKNYLKTNGVKLTKIEKGVYACNRPHFRYVAYTLNEIGNVDKNRILLLFSSKYKKKLPELFKGAKRKDLEILEHIVKILEKEAKKMHLSSAGRKAMKMDLSQIHEEVTKNLLKGLTVKERLEGVPVKERLEGVTVKEILEGVPVKEILEGVPVKKILENFNPEEILKGVSKKDKEKFKKLLMDS